MRLSPWIRTLLPVVLLAATALFLDARSQPETLVPRPLLKDFPDFLQGWQGESVRIDAQTREILGDGDFMERYYTAPLQGPVDLFVAYFPTQRTGTTMHSPKNCLPGSGWTPVESSPYPLTAPGGRRIEVNRYIIARGEQRQVVLYWYQSHGHYIASEYVSKIRLVLDAVRLHRSDGALVRVITPVSPAETTEAATARAARFAELALPQLERFIPR